jgi:hypothetical protein
VPSEVLRERGRGVVPKGVVCRPVHPLAPAHFSVHRSVHSAKEGPCYPWLIHPSMVAELVGPPPSVYGAKGVRAASPQP